MQKSRILLYLRKRQALLTLFFLPIISFLLLFLVLNISSVDKKPQEKVLGVAQAKVIQYTPPTIVITVTKPTTFPTRIPTLVPTKIPAPTLTPIITKAPRVVSQSSSPTDYILQKVNEYRISKGETSVITNSETCNFAKVRAEEISSINTFNHDGFTKRVQEKTLPYPGYHEVTENIAYNTDFTDVVNRWIASPDHEANMRKNTQYVCIGKYGDHYTYEGWQP